MCFCICSSDKLPAYSGDVSTRLDERLKWTHQPPKTPALISLFEEPILDPNIVDGRANLSKLND